MINTNVKYIFLSLTLFITSLNAQRTLSAEPEAGEKNPERAHNKSELINPDSLGFMSENDTLFIQTSDGDSLDIPLEESSIKDNLVDMLYGAIFRDSTKNKYIDESNLTESEEKYLPYQGQVIANIYISKVPVFGGSVDDTLEFTVSSIEKFGNSLHTNTKDWVIYNNLFMNWLIMKGFLDDYPLFAMPEF